MTRGVFDVLMLRNVIFQTMFLSARHASDKSIYRLTQQPQSTLVPEIRAFWACTKTREMLKGSSLHWCSLDFIPLLFIQWSIFGQ